MLIYAKKMRLPKVGSKFDESMAIEERPAMWISLETFERVNALTWQHGVKYVEVEQKVEEEKVEEKKVEEKKPAGRPKKSQTKTED